MVVVSCLHIKLFSRHSPLCAGACRSRPPRALRGIWRRAAFMGGAAQTFRVLCRLAALDMIGSPWLLQRLCMPDMCQLLASTITAGFLIPVFGTIFKGWASTVCVGGAEAWICRHCGTTIYQVNSWFAYRRQFKAEAARSWIFKQDGDLRRRSGYAWLPNVMLIVLVFISHHAIRSYPIWWRIVGCWFAATQSMNLADRFPSQA